MSNKQFQNKYLRQVKLCPVSDLSVSILEIRERAPSVLICWSVGDPSCQTIIIIRDFCLCNLKKKNKLQDYLLLPIRDQTVKQINDRSLRISLPSTKYILLGQRHTFQYSYFHDAGWFSLKENKERTNVKSLQYLKKSSIEFQTLVSNSTITLVWIEQDESS